jgi:preprotein translocase subunit SecA
VEHLTEVDAMRQGIGLRGFAQEDPLNAFKKEAFGLFEEMSSLIRHQVAATIFRVSLVRQPPPPPEGTENRGSEEPVEAAAGASSGSMGPSGSFTSAGGTTSVAAAAAAIAAAGGRTLPKALPQGRPVGGSSSSSSDSGGSSGSGGNGSGAARPGYSPAGIRMGRNDQCWCGSGKKYKKCHGR